MNNGEEELWRSIDAFYKASNWLLMNWDGLLDIFFFFLWEDYLTLCLKGCGLILPQLKWLFMFEGGNARKATKLNSKLPSMRTKL